MRLRTVLVCVGVLSSLLALPFSASAETGCGQFTRNLKLGISGEDVRALQVFLNADTRTKIAESGLGSPGNESTYFGGKTKLAVAKFQELYKSEVLAPAGLTRGSGLVGALSRAKIAALCGAAGNISATTNTTKPAVAAPTPSVASAPVTASALLASPVAIESPNLKPYLIQPASYAVAQGGKLSIIGGGFSGINTVHIGSVSYTGVVPTKKNRLEVTIPASAATGKFDLWFSNAKGETRKTFIVVTKPGAVAPKVTSFTPMSGFIGTTVTVTGENLSKDWNDIVVGAKTITGVVSPDGKSLSFVATLPLPGVASGEDVANISASSPLWFYVVNPNGVSGSSIFTLKI